MTAKRDLTTNIITLINDGNNYERESPLVNALYALEDVDTYIIGEGYCICNYAMGCTVWSCYADMCYYININEIETMAEGDEVILSPHAPDEYEREQIAAEYGEEVAA